MVIDRARALGLLAEIGAPARLVTHARLVGEAGDRLVALVAGLGIALDADLVRVGIALHDVGKTLHPGELDGPGERHEADGERLLLERGVDPVTARVCRSHAQWASMECSLEELLVALADKLWKGVRARRLEEVVIDAIAARLGQTRWDVFVELDDGFEAIASGGDERLARSR